MEIDFVDLLEDHDDSSLNELIFHAGTVFEFLGPVAASSHSLSECSYAGWVEVDSCRDEVAEEDPAGCPAGSLHSLQA
jgi:hypothetical protein